MTTIADNYIGGVHGYERYRIRGKELNSKEPVVTDVVSTETAEVQAGMGDWINVLNSLLYHRLLQIPSSIPRLHSDQAALRKKLCV